MTANKKEVWSRRITGWKACATFLVLALLAVVRADTGSGLSGNISVDTRTLTMTGLVVTGPSSLPWGSQAAYTATLSYSGAAAQDVTAECAWSVTGGPKVSNWWEQPAMGGNVLTPGVASSTPLMVTASVTRNNGRIVSAPFPVTVTESNGMNVGIGLVWPTQSGPVYVRTDAGGFVWRIAAVASGLAADKQGVTFQWTLNGQALATGKNLDTEFTGTSGTRQLSVLATDTQGRTGQAIRELVFDAPPVVNEPPTQIKAADPKFGDVLNETGGTFGFDSLKTPNGLIVLTHGIYQDGYVDWLQEMAVSIRTRLTNEGKPLPNIMVFDWGSRSNPSKSSGFDAAHDRALQSAKSALTGIPILISDVFVGFFADIILVRPDAQSEGQELADWIRTEITNGHIVAGQKIHLIGHSAGGFVVGEAGWQLRNLCTNLRVTMLDTPIPYFNHVWRFPAAGRKLDRYVSSVLGAIEWPVTWGSSIEGDYDNYRVLVNASPLAGPLIPTIAAHSYSHEWYQGMVPGGAAGSEGFGWSPLLQPPSFAPSAAPGKEGTAATLAPVETTVPITGFTTFGSATSDATGFVLTEGASQNAGVTRAAFTFPAGTHSLRFSFRFTTPGDGDFLSVSFGDNPPIFIGKDMPLSRDGELTTDVPVEDIGSQQGDLVFRLVSRGSQNAVMTVHGIVAVTVEDADQDGLTNAQEVALGTNPMKADTDGDGISDAAEVNIYHTNPLLADTDGDGVPDGVEIAAGTDPKNPASRFAITSATFGPTGFTLQWPALTTRSYRVLRSATPGFLSYDVIGFALPGVSPVMTFTDTTVQPGVTPQMFYKIQIEPQP